MFGDWHDSCIKGLVKAPLARDSLTPLVLTFAEIDRRVAKEEERRRRVHREAVEAAARARALRRANNTRRVPPPLVRTDTHAVEFAWADSRDKCTPPNTPSLSRTSSVSTSGSWTSVTSTSTAFDRSPSPTFGTATTALTPAPLSRAAAPTATLPHAAEAAPAVAPAPVAPAPVAPAPVTPAAAPLLGVDAPVDAPAASDSLATIAVDAAPASPVPVDATSPLQLGAPEYVVRERAAMMLVAAGYVPTPEAFVIVRGIEPGLYID